MCPHTEQERQIPRVIDPNSFMTYLYGYKAALNDQDMDRVNLLMDISRKSACVRTLFVKICKTRCK